MDFYKLKCYVSVARHLNFTKAAEDCHITQTAMSRQIACLEEQLGVTLLYRDSRVVELTPAGDHFLCEAIFLLEYYSGMVDRTQKASMGITGSIKIGVGPYEHALLCKAMQAFSELYPQIEITCLQFSYKILAYRYKKGLIDIALCSSSCAEQFDLPVLNNLYPESWGICAHNEHPFMSMEPEDQKILKEQTLIILQDDYGDDMKQLCAQHGYRPHHYLQTNFLCAQLAMIESKLGVAFLPEFLKNSLPANVTMTNIGEHPFMTPFVFAHAPNNHNPAIKPFLDVYKSLI